MAKHKTDNLGHPRNPQMRKLEDELQILAGIFRAAFGNEGEQTEIAKEYQEVLDQLYELGWDGRLDIQSELPSKYMPERYLEANPPRDYFREDYEWRIAKAMEQPKSSKQIEENKGQKQKRQVWFRRIFKWL